MVGNDLLSRHPHLQFAEDSLDRHARASDDRLAAHDPRIDLDAFVRCHRALLRKILAAQSGV
jgi:hypothetical protein